MYEDDDNEYGYEVKSENCPICSMEKIKPVELYAYLLKICGKNEKDVSKEIRNKFKNYKEFQNFIKLKDKN